MAIREPKWTDEIDEILDGLLDDAPLFERDEDDLVYWDEYQEMLHPSFYYEDLDTQSLNW
jgi:hypothetical protein